MRKLVYCIADGMADEPACASGAQGGETPLQAAMTPNMDHMARHSVAGLCHVIPPGFAPDSDVGNMALLGYAPQEHHTGRAAFEALGRGVALQPDDLVWRLSLVQVGATSLGPVMEDAQGAGISAGQGREALARCQEGLPDPTFALYEDHAYRHLLVQRGAAAAPEARLAVPGPHMLLGQPLLPVLAQFPGALREVVDSLSRCVADSEGPANGIWLWGQGGAPRWPAFHGVHGLSGCLVAGISLLRGMGRAAGLHVVEDARFTGTPETDLRAKAEAAIDFLGRGGDVAFIHVDAPDHCAHAGSREGKQQAIEAVDTQLLGPLLAALPEAVIVVTCDHATSCRTRTHLPGPVPYLVYRNDMESGLRSLTEESARTGTEVPGGPELLALAFGLCTR